MKKWKEGCLSREEQKKKFNRISQHSFPASDNKVLDHPTY
jgi:hypothetical protein